MIYFIHNSRSQAYLITVRGITVRRGGNNFSLRQLTRQRFRYLFKRIGSACNAHGAVNIGSTRKRIAYCTAYAGCRPAERLYFGGVIVGLVFKEQQPVLVRSVNIHLDFNGAGVYFFRFVQLFKAALGF